jgi:hypothetical protein
MSKARQLADLGNVYDDGALSNRNRIINGAMVIDQRNGGSAVTPTADGTYTLDRWQSQLSASSKFSVQKSSTAPDGFSSSMLITSLSAFSVASGSYFRQAQVIEGFNTADLGWGTASAQDVTLSFWVRSSLTGTFGGAINNSAQNRSYPFTYTISTANTWEQKTLTIAGDTSGTWNTNNLGGVIVSLGLGVGSTYSGTAGAWAGATYLSATGATSVVGTNGATFYFTGVQLEVGDLSTATPFEHIPYSDQLARCQRYYQTIKAASGSGYRRFARGHVVGSSLLDCSISLPVEMRTFPTLVTTGVAGDYAIYHENTVTACNTTPELNTASDDGVGTVISMNAFVSSGLTVGQGAALLSNNLSTSFLAFSAEL